MVLAAVRGGTAYADAIRVCALDVDGSPLAGASSMIQSDNIVKLTTAWEVQSGTDISQTNGQGAICLSYKAPDTMKRLNTTVQICDDDLLLKQLLAGGTLFTDTPTRTVSDGVTATDTSLVSATAAFTDADIGDTVSGTGIFAGSTIISRQSGTHVTLSHATTATATGVSVTISGPTGVTGYQPPKVGVIGTPNGVSVELWVKRIVRDTQVGWVHLAIPRNFLAINDADYTDAFADMSFKGYAVESANWGSGPVNDFLHDSTACIQEVFAAALPTPLQDGYQTVT